MEVKVDQEKMAERLKQDHVEDRLEVLRNLTGEADLDLVFLLGCLLAWRHLVGVLFVVETAEAERGVWGEAGPPFTPSQPTCLTTNVVCQTLLLATFFGDRPFRLMASRTLQIKEYKVKLQRIPHRARVLRPC